MSATLPAATPRARVFLIVLAIVIAVFLVYWPGLGGGFVFDDTQNLVANPGVRVGHGGDSTWLKAAFSSPASDLQRPLSMLSFAANYYFTGYDSRAMKLTNVGIHALNALLAFALVWRVAKRAAPTVPPLRVAGFTAAMWALHPINLMAVLYVVQRMESLCHTFVLLGLICYCIGRELQGKHRHGWPSIGAALLVFPVLGLLSKESAVLLPLYALVLEAVLYRFESHDGRRHRGLLVTFLFVLVIPALAGGGWLLSRAIVPGAFGTRGYTPWERVMTEGRVVLDYLQWTLLPNLRQLSLYHDDYVISRGLLAPASTLPALIAIALLAVAAWKLQRKRPLTAIGIAWFLCAHTLTGTIVPLELVFEHRNYFASLGVCLAIVDLLLVAPARFGRQRPALIFATGFVCLLAMLTAMRAQEWRDPLRFAETEAEKHPNSPRATYERARMLIIASNYDEKSPYTRLALPALERALAVDGSGTLPAQAALIFAARTGQPLQARWWQVLQERLAQRPGAPESQLSLIALTHCAIDDQCKFPVADMQATFDAGLSKGDESGVLSTFGNYSLNVVGDYELAYRLWTEAARLAPSNAQFQANLAALAIRMGRYSEAEKAIAAMRVLGHFNQYSAQADELNQVLARARQQTRPAPASR